MQPTLDIRRHNNGSIDFDFYRRRATRRRRLVRRLVFKHLLSMGGQMINAGVSAIANLKMILSRRPAGAGSRSYTHVPVHRRMRAFDRDRIRGGHYGQRSWEPR